MGAVAPEEAAAAVRISRDLWNRHPEAVKAAMQTVLDVSKSDNLKQSAKESLDRAEEKLRQSTPKK